MRQNRQKGVIVNAKKILPPTYLLISIVAIIAIHFLLPTIAGNISFPWNLLGMIPLASGVILSLVANHAFQRAGTTVKPFAESSVLVTSGTFRICRNPMYLGFVLILIGAAVLGRSVIAFSVVLAFAILIDRMFVTVEERMLAAKFGDRWEEYKRSTRRWL